MARRKSKINPGAWRDLPSLFDNVEIYKGPSEDDVFSPLDDSLFEMPERLRFMSFGSGSSGNCAYIGTPASGLLIDAGVDVNYVTEQLKLNSIDINSIGGILLTHDHLDHIRFVYALLRRHAHLRLYATPRALAGLMRRHRMSSRVKDYHQPIFKEFPFKVGNLMVTAFETSHDGSDNNGFFIEGADSSFAVMTDTGIITARADYYIRQSRHLMIESNYDLTMLRNGRYAQHLKARIESETGHLDNEVTAAYLASIAKATGLRNVFLCHLSQDNNTPQIALSVSRDALERAGVDVVTSATAGPKADRLFLSVLPRSVASPLIML